jgi:protein phosphatase
MGGHAAGDVASALAVAAFEDLATAATVTRREVLEAIRKADRTIWDEAARNHHEGMGTTLVGMAITNLDASEEAILVFNIGDSRAYVLRHGVLRQLSHDHSVVQELIDRGAITEEEALMHPERNVITRSLGSGAHLEIDSWIFPAEPSDRYLLCTDGLVKELDETTIAALLDASQPPDKTADRLLSAALEAGGRDNISLVVVDVSTVSVDAEPVPLDDDTNPTFAAVDPLAPITLPVVLDVAGESDG